MRAVKFRFAEKFTLTFQAFDRGDYTDFCLAHLFTHQRFSSGTLGLAYIGTDREGALGGICSPRESFCRLFFPLVPQSEQLQKTVKPIRFFFKKFRSN